MEGKGGGGRDGVCEKIVLAGARKWSGGRLTFYKTAVLSQVLVLSIFLVSPRISHYLVPAGQQQDEVAILNVAGN